MCNGQFLIFVALLVGVACADVVLPTMPPLIQQFTRIESCKMIVYAEYPPMRVYVLEAGLLKAKLLPRRGEEMYCCEGWQDAEGDFDGTTSVCSKQQANSTPYVTSEEYKDVLEKVAEIRRVHERIKALETLVEKTKALGSRVRFQQQNIDLLQRLLST